MGTRRKRGAFTPEYKAEVVRLVAAGDRTPGQVARDLELTETSVRAWVGQADIDAGKGKHAAAGRPTSARRNIKKSDGSSRSSRRRRPRRRCLYYARFWRYREAASARGRTAVVPIDGRREARSGGRRGLRDDLRVHRGLRQRDSPPVDPRVPEHGGVRDEI